MRKQRDYSSAWQRSPKVGHAGETAQCHWPLERGFDAIGAERKLGGRAEAPPHKRMWEKTRWHAGETGQCHLIVNRAGAAVRWRRAEARRKLKLAPQTSPEEN